jgi:polyhydroxyalkanoate synthase
MARARLRLPYGPDVPLGLPSSDTLLAASLNVWTKLARGHLADLTPMPRDLLHTAPQAMVHRYRGERAPGAAPVLLVPPLAAPARCFDLRRGCSYVEHLVGTGRPPYLVDYGEIAFADRRLGLEHWIDGVVPTAVRVAADDAGEPVHVVAWCLGGILSLLALAADPDLPVASVTVIASPFDVTAVPLVAPLRPVALLTGGRLGTVAYRAMGGAPAFLVRRMFQLSSVDRYLTKPLAVLTHLDDRDFLAQIEAVDDFTAHMLAYPGRTFGQLYHRFLRANDLAGGSIDIAGRRLALDDVRVPVLAIAGRGDTIAPVAAVHHVGALLRNAAQVRLETAPGGHLGVLTGRGARTTTWAIVDDWLQNRTRAAQPDKQTTLKGRPASAPYHV